MTVIYGYDITPFATSAAKITPVPQDRITRLVALVRKRTGAKREKYLARMAARDRAAVLYAEARLYPPSQGSVRAKAKAKARLAEHDNEPKRMINAVRRRELKARILEGRRLTTR